MTKLTDRSTQGPNPMDPDNGSSTTKLPPKLVTPLQKKVDFSEGIGRGRGRRNLGGTMLASELLGAMDQGKKKEKLILRPVQSTNYSRDTPRDNKQRNNGINTLSIKNSVGFRLATEVLGQKVLPNLHHQKPMTRKQKKAQSLNGINLAQLTAEGQEITPSEGSNRRKYRGLDRRDFNIRMKVTISSLHDEDYRYEKVKEWYKVLYKANNSIVIYQWDESKEGLQLEHPDRFPETYEECVVFFGDMRAYSNKFCWTIRVSEIGTFKALRDDLYVWNTRNRGWVTFDVINAQRIARLGWFRELPSGSTSPKPLQALSEGKTCCTSSHT